jgi:hypothetical protein
MVNEAVKPKKIKEQINPQLKSEQKESIKHLIEKHKQAFSFSEYDLGQTRFAKHKINSEQIKQAPYSCPRHLRPVMEEKIKELLNHELIEPSESPWSSPVVLVRKKDGTIRFCVDFRKLNANTLKDAYPLPKPEEQIEILAKAKYFSLLDLASGFWQILMDKNDKEKTAFVINNGLYQFKVMPMGLTNAPLTFQRAMDKIL